MNIDGIEVSDRYLMQYYDHQMHIIATFKLVQGVIRRPRFPEDGRYCDWRQECLNRRAPGIRLQCHVIQSHTIVLVLAICYVYLCV